MDVTLEPNPNEVSEVKYVSKDELNAMFADPGKSSHVVPYRFSQWIYAEISSQLFHTLV